ncbi:hypothetical protein BC941DRAFT_508190 [Chlamydoabsidia padenii]|nr:hypothetical protein BC941DRAFT_508190 [Chlamydoabsidia padenii]
MYDGKKDKTKDYHLQLHMAATNGNVGLVKFALDHGAPIDSVVNGFLPLQLACISDNNIAVVQYLIDRGAQVNAQRWSKKHSADKSQAVAGAIGSTALHVACANGCSKIVDLLLRNDARVDLKDKYGSRPLDIAAAKHHMEIVKLLETFGALQRHESSYQGGRRSMDVIYSTKKQHHQQQQHLSTSNSYQSTTPSSSLDDRAERMRRPSLPSVFEGKSHFSKRKPSTPSLDIPPLSTLPPAPHQYINKQQSTSDQQASSMDNNTTHSIDIIRHRRPSRNKLPELAWSKSSDDTMIGTPPPLPHQKNTTNLTTATKPDWYSHGVLHHDGNENYLTSLERRAYGLDDMPTRQSFDQVRPHRLSLETILDPHQTSSTDTTTSPRPSLKRCSSDGGHLRTTALMNAMAAKKSSLDPVPPLPITMTTTQEEPEPEETMPRHSLATEDEALRQFEEKEMKKAWWSAFGGRKSMDVATYQRHHLQHQDSFSSSRPSLDFRPSFDVGGGMCPGQNATGEEVDMNFEADEYEDEPQKNRQRKPGFFTRWVGAWSKKGG